jgi:hypothetical protein
MGLISAQKEVTPAEFYGRRSVLQPGNREWVITIEATCADGFPLPPYVVFQGAVYIGGWFELNLRDWRIKVLNNGWTTKKIGLRAYPESC